MPSNKEILFQNHLCAFLEDKHEYVCLSNGDVKDKEFHFIEKHLIEFIIATQPEKYAELEENYKTDTNNQIFNALKEAVAKKRLWLIMRDGLMVKGTKIELYKPKPRSSTNTEAEKLFSENIFSYIKEYRYNKINDEEIDLVIWLNGLPIIAIELKHEDEGRNCEDAVFESFLTRDLSNNIYKLPFIYIASSNTEVKIATDPVSEEKFRWFNAQMLNKAETIGEYPVEHLYRHALSKENITKYLEHYLVFVPAQEKIIETGEIIRKTSFTIFPRYHQLQYGGNTIIWFSADWSLELYQQANARLHRQGQSKPVNVYHLITEKTIDEDVIKSLASKSKGQESLMQAIRARQNKYKNHFIH